MKPDELSDEWFVKRSGRLAFRRPKDYEALRRRWTKRIRKWREELERGSNAPDIIGCCLLLTRKTGRKAFEPGALSLASRPSADFKLPEKSLLDAALAELGSDPVVVALIEKLTQGWVVQELIQWRMERGRITPTILHVRQYRRRGGRHADAGVSIRAMIGEALGKMAADILLQRVTQQADLRKDVGLLGVGTKQLEAKPDTEQAAS